VKCHSIPLSEMLQNLSVPSLVVGFLKRVHVGSRNLKAFRDRDCKYICRTRFSCGPRMNADEYREFRTNGNCAAWLCLLFKCNTPNISDVCNGCSEN